MKKLLRPLFATCAAGFLIYAAWDLHSKWEKNTVEVELLPLLASFFFAALAMLIQLFGWRSLVYTWTGKRMPRVQSARLYLDSQMARYTPAKIGLPAVRIAGASQVGVSPQVMAATLGAELLSWVGSGTLVGAAALGVSPTGAGTSEEISLSAQVIAALSLVGLLLVTNVDRRHLPSRLIAAFGADGSGPLVPRQLPLWHFAHFASWIGCGALLCASVGGSGLTLLVVGGLLCLAIVAGFLALLAPAGAGVREAVMAVGAAPLIGAPSAVAVGVLARVASLSTDVALWAWFRLRARRLESET